MSPRVSASARSLLELLTRIDVHAAPGRGQPEENARPDRDEGGVGQDHAVDADVLRARQDGLAEGIERPHGQPGQDERERAPAEGEHDALGEELSEHAPPAGADRDAHGDLPPPRRRARHQQVGQVGARDEEHEDDGSEQDEHGAPHVFHERGLERLRLRRRPLVLGVLGDDLLGQAMEVRSGAGRGGLGEEPPDHGQEVVVVRVQVVAGRERHGHDGLCVEPEEREPRGQDPDDGVGLGAEHDLSPDDRGVARVAPPPEPIRQEDDAMIAPALVGGQEIPSHRGRSAEGGEEFRRGDQYADALRLPVAGHVERPDIEGRQRLEGTIARAVHVEIRHRRRPGAVALVHGLYELQAAGVRIGQGPEQDRIHHAEHHGVGPDAEAEDEERGRGEAGAAAHHAQGETAVLDDHVQEREAAPVAVELLGLLDASELEEGGAARLFRRQARPDVVRDVHLQVTGQLVVELSLPARAAPEREGAPAQRPQRPHDEALVAKKRASTAVVCCQSCVSFSTCVRPARVRR